jgi:hypothetical protein
MRTLRKATRGRNVGDICYPQLIWPGSGEVPFNKVGRERCIAIARRGSNAFSATRTLKMALLHQPRKPIAAHVDSLGFEFGLDTRPALRAAGTPVDCFDTIAEQQMCLLAVRRLWGKLRVVAAGADVQRFAECSNAVPGLVAFHESEDSPLAWRSSTSSEYENLKLEAA